jgi:hypothetical protein
LLLSELGHRATRDCDIESSINQRGGIAGSFIVCAANAFDISSRDFIAEIEAGSL